MPIIDRYSFRFLLFSILLTVCAAPAFSAVFMKPFILANKGSDYQGVLAATKKKLIDAGFQVLGEYTPYGKATVIIITDDELIKNAEATEFGGYGVVQRVAVTDVAGEVQVAYTNPMYMASAYRMKGDLAAVADRLKKALGFIEEFGCAVGLTAKDLADYKYMFGMPKFHQQFKLMEYPDYKAAVDAVEAGLAEQKGGVSRIYRIDLPNKQQTIIGVSMTVEMSSDATIMKEVDFKPIRSTPHLPHELLIHSDGKVRSLDPKFRIAINFPDLEMSGNNSFIGIMGTPDAIYNSMALVSGGETLEAQEDEYDF